MRRRFSRRGRRGAADSALGGMVLFGLVVLWPLLRQVARLPLPWLIVSATMALSLAALLIWLVARLAGRARRARLIQGALRDLSSTAFEARVGLLLRDLGWTEVQQRGGSGDRSVDLTGRRDGLRYLVQCKRVRGAVPPAQVRDLVGALHIQGADRALLVTTGTFTAQGYAEASSQPLELWDGEALARQIAAAEVRRADPQQQQAIRDRRARWAALVVALNAALILWALLTAGRPF